jgi:tetratricopeptide (TPR) repeat protein
MIRGLIQSAQIGKAQGLLIKKKYANANDLLSKVLTKNPSKDLEVVALIQKGEALHHLNSNEEALMCFNKAINVYKSFPVLEPIDKNNQIIGRAVQYIDYINNEKT